MCLRTEGTEKDPASLLSYSTKNAKLLPIHEKTLNIKQIQIRDSRLNNQIITHQTTKVMKGKERLRNCPRLEETKEIGQLNAVWDPTTNPAPEKDIKRDI